MNALFGGVFNTEALEQSPDDIALDDSGDNLRVEALGLRAVSQYEDFFLRVGCQWEGHPCMRPRRGHMQ